MIEQRMISPRSLEVLDSEFIEDALERWNISGELKQAIQGDLGGTFTAASYASKKVRIDRTTT